MSEETYKEKVSDLHQKSERHRRRNIRLSMEDTDDFYDKLKITVIKKLVRNDVAFCRQQDRVRHALGENHKVFALRQRDSL